MAQASSAQREPSMEEILASIRRIIEDSDDGQKDAGAEELYSARPGANDQDPQSRDVEAFRQEFSSPVAERVEPSFDDDHETSAPEQQVVEPIAAATVVSMHRDRGEEQVVTAEQSAEDRFDGSEDVAAGEQDDDVTADIETSRQTPGPILSDIAGRQVSAAFEQLSEAFAASRRRSFDEIAEEMMRPMLQEWLDNNLPVLVERLVREEIERVARGTAR